MDTDSTTVDYKIIDVFPPEEVPFQYENLQKEDNPFNYERLDLQVCEAIFTLQFNTCNLSELSVNVVAAEKLSVKLFRQDQGKLIQDIYQYKKILIDNKMYTFSFKPNQTCQCILEIVFIHFYLQKLTKNKAVKIKSIILKSQPYPEFPQIQKGQQQAVGQKQDKLKIIPKPNIDLVGSQPIQELNHPPKMHAKIQTQHLNKKEEEQKEMKLQQFVRDSSTTPIHINGQKNDQIPNKQLPKKNEHNAAQAARGADKHAVNNKKQQFETQAQEDDVQEFKNYKAKPQDVQVNQYQTVAKNTQNNRGMDMVVKAKQQEEMNQKKKQQEQEEVLRERNAKKKMPKKQAQKQQQPMTQEVNLDTLKMFTPHPSDVSPQMLAIFQQKGIDLLKRYKALMGLKFYINQQQLDDGIVQQYGKIITDNGGEVQQEINDWTDYVISNEVMPSVEIKSTQSFLRFQFLDDFQPQEKPIFENYIIE
ncbi:hypothetical protein pb186bvf_004738 [Paramecium bursaria]